MKAQGAPRARRRVSSAAWEPCRGLGSPPRLAPTTRRVSPLAPGVTSIKIDPYLNLDAGTMSPFEHGEVYTLDDGGEADLDLGNYERFLDVILGSDSNLTTGKIYKRVIERERAGEYLG